MRISGSGSILNYLLHYNLCFNVTFTFDSRTSSLVSVLDSGSGLGLGSGYCLTLGSDGNIQELSE